MSWQSLLAMKIQKTSEPDFYVDSNRPGITRRYCAFRKIDKQGAANKLSDWMPYRSMMDWLDGYITAKESAQLPA